MSSCAVPYARALADAVEAVDLDPGQVRQELLDFAATLGSNKELREVLLNPAHSAKKRIAVLDAMNRITGATPQVRNFLAVLIERERLAFLDEILEQYRVEMNRRLRISNAEVVTARRLEKEERVELENHVAELAGTEVRIAFREDSSLLGGIIVRIGSTVYDGSVRGRLDRLKDRLVAN